MKKEDRLKLQIETSFVYILSLLISIAITYNDYLNVQKKNSIFTDKQERNLSVFNRTLVIVLSLIYLYINFKDRDDAVRNNEELWPFNLQIMSSELSVLATIIVLYVVVSTSGEQYSIVPGIENPTL